MRLRVSPSAVAGHKINTASVALAAHRTRHELEARAHHIVLKVLVAHPATVVRVTLLGSQFGQIFSFCSNSDLPPLQQTLIKRQRSNCSFSRLELHIREPLRSSICALRYRSSLDCATVFEMLLKLLVNNLIIDISDAYGP